MSDVMAEIGAAVTLGRTGDEAGARSRLLALWDGDEIRDDPYHRCVLAHYLADLYEPAEAVVWDERAVAEADSLRSRAGESGSAMESRTLAAQVSGFYPSLYLNLADNHRRLGDFESARRYLDLAAGVQGHLPAGEYGEQIRGWLREVEARVTSRTTEALPG